MAMSLAQIVRDERWHDATLASFELNGRVLSLKIKTNTRSHRFRMKLTDVLEIDPSQDWGPSNSIDSITCADDGALSIKMQSGLKVSAKRLKLLEHTIRDRS